MQPAAFAWYAFVTPGQDGNAPATRLQGTRKFFDDRSLSCAANREVADADDQAAERSLAENSFPVKVKAKLNQAFINERQRVENSAQNRSASALTTPENDVDAELFQIFKPPAHEQQ
jgi:hypothetical protein